METAEEHVDSVVLIPKEGARRAIKCSYKAVQFSAFIRNLAEAREEEDRELTVNLPNVKAEVLGPVVQYMQLLAANPAAEAASMTIPEYAFPKQDYDDRDLSELPFSFFALMPSGFLSAILRGADYLDIPQIVKVVSYILAQRIGTKSCRELEDAFASHDGFGDQEKLSLLTVFASYRPKNFMEG